jgi:pimeloyl-ACP methyl ester carboxylesterase
MRAIADAMPNAAFVEIADAGHLAPLEQPGAFNDAVMSFLTE